MKFSRVKRLSSTILSILLLLSAASPALAADIYVNGDGTLSGDLGSAYAVGGSGSVDPVSDGYAITADGIERIDTGGSGGGGAGTPGEAPVSGTVAIASNTIKVGLKYAFSGRDSSVEYADLQNVTGSGYQLGYYDGSRNFVALTSTAETKITVAKDTNVSLPSGTLGCYHILLGATYSSASDASAAAGAYPDGFPAYYDGVYHVLVGNYTSQSAAASAAGSRGISGTAFSASSRCAVVTKTGTTQILFEFDYGDAYSLGVLPISNGAKAVTQFNGTNYYGGFEFHRINGLSLTVINVVNLEDYVMGVVASEMSYSWPLEALKAQAVCARTYAARLIKNSSYYSYGGYDLTGDTYCQAYSGTSRLGDAVVQAVNGTAGLCVTYNGALIEALYSSSDGGGTEDNLNVNGTDVPYLKGVLDPYEAAADSVNSHAHWSVSFSAASLGAKIKMGSIVSVVPTYSATGNVIRIALTDSAGSTLSYQRSACCTVFGLNSIHYTVTKQADGSWLFSGSGWGHSVGMSQYGAWAMASAYGFDFKQIIGFYYTGVSLTSAVYA